jgi:hypothetical protein
VGNGILQDESGTYLYKRAILTGEQPPPPILSKDGFNIENSLPDSFEASVQYGNNNTSETISIPQGGSSNFVPEQGVTPPKEGLIARLNLDIPGYGYIYYSMVNSEPWYSPF